MPRLFYTVYQVLFPVKNSLIEPKLRFTDLQYMEMIMYLRETPALDHSITKSSYH